jgi:hypothetical protein
VRRPPSSVILPFPHPSPVANTAVALCVQCK